MRLPGLKKARLGGRWLRGRLLGGVPILGYHRVADRSDDPYSMCVGARRFAEQIEVLRREARPVALRELVRARQRGELPRRAVVVTFDDGYADNLRNALPVLERHEVPATVFVTTGQLGKPFWWDLLARALQPSAAAADQLEAALARIPGNGGAHRLELRGPRRKVLGDLSLRIQQMSPEARQDLVRTLRRAALEPETAGADRALCEAELRELAGSRLVDIGSHGASHSPLADLAVDRQRTEIGDSKRLLEEILGRRVTSFAYPHGSIGPATPGLVREAGFDCACGSLNDLVSARSHPYRLPRFWIGDWDGARFGRWLSHWLRS